MDIDDKMGVEPEAEWLRILHVPYVEEEEKAAKWRDPWICFECILIKLLVGLSGGVKKQHMEMWSVFLGKGSA